MPGRSHKHRRLLSRCSWSLRKGSRRVVLVGSMRSTSRPSCTRRILIAFWTISSGSRYALLAGTTSIFVCFRARTRSALWARSRRNLQGPLRPRSHSPSLHPSETVLCPSQAPQVRAVRRTRRNGRYQPVRLRRQRCNRLAKSRWRSRSTRRRSTRKRGGRKRARRRFVLLKCRFNTNDLEGAQAR